MRICITGKSSLRALAKDIAKVIRETRGDSVSVVMFQDAGDPAKFFKEVDRATAVIVLLGRSSREPWVMVLAAIGHGKPVLCLTGEELSPVEIALSAMIGKSVCILTRGSPDSIAVETLPQFLENLGLVDRRQTTLSISAPS